MSPSKRRTRRRRLAEARAARAQVESAPPELRSEPPEPYKPWNWRTFPVYFALSTGIFFGIYIGAAAFSARGDNGNDMPFLVVSVVAALFFGFGLSRFFVRFMVSRRWIRPRARKRSR